MTIEQLGEGRVLVSLKAQDIDRYHINIDKLNLRDKDTRESLKSLMSLVLKESGINPDGRAVLVEAMPHKDGMIILISVDSVKKLRKVYKVKRPLTIPACRFRDAEGLMGCVERLGFEEVSLGENSLWQFEEDFYLLFECCAVSPRAKAVLSEFSDFFSLSLVRVARIKEAGKLLAEKNAVQRINEAISAEGDLR